MFLDMKSDILIRFINNYSSMLRKTQEESLTSIWSPMLYAQRFLSNYRLDNSIFESSVVWHTPLHLFTSSSRQRNRPLGNFSFLSLIYDLFFVRCANSNILLTFYLKYSMRFKLSLISGKSGQ